jgi:hypothetical protein
MTEVNDTYRMPEMSTTEFVDNTQLDFHKATQEAAPYEPIRLTREARNLAFSNDTQPTDLELVPNPAQLQDYSGAIVDFRGYTLAGQLNIFEDKGTL